MCDLASDLVPLLLLQHDVKGTQLLVLVRQRLAIQEQAWRVFGRTRSAQHCEVHFLAPVALLALKEALRCDLTF